MSKLDNVILGFNHMFLYPESMEDVNAHTETLRKMAENPLIDTLDCWVWGPHAKEEISILRNSGKRIVYTAGDRLGDVPSFPASADPKERAYAMYMLQKETEFALECGAHKFIFGSGRDVPEAREEAIKRYADFVMEWADKVPRELTLALEPIDRDVHKFFLLGTLEDSVRCMQMVRNAGFDNVGILLDMGHIPLLHETMEGALSKTLPLIKHIHLASCIIKNKDNPLFGDKHVCWGGEDGEYDENDGVRFMNLLKEYGYFSRGYDQTVSFEMRPLTGMTAEETIVYLDRWFWNVMDELKK